jgi:hypothetical protein
MTVLLVLALFGLFLTIDYFCKTAKKRVVRGTMYTTPGYEFLGALAQDGGQPVDKFLGENI